MTKSEHENLQNALDRMLHRSMYTVCGRVGSWSDGFKQGIMVAKATLRNEYKSKQRKDNNND